MLVLYLNGGLPTSSWGNWLKLWLCSFLIVYGNVVFLLIKLNELHENSLVYLKNCDMTHRWWPCNLSKVYSCLLPDGISSSANQDGSMYGCMDMTHCHFYSNIDHLSKNYFKNSFNIELQINHEITRGREIFTDNIKLIELELFSSEDTQTHPRW